MICGLLNADLIKKRSVKFIKKYKTMKTFVRISLIVAFLVVAAATAQAQRVVEGTVYREGKPAAGITVEVHRGGSMMTTWVTSSSSTSPEGGLTGASRSSTAAT